MGYQSGKGPGTLPIAEELALHEQLNLVIARLSRQLRQQAAPGLSPTQVATLYSLEPSSMTLGELAAAERVQPPTMTVIVDRLAEHGLVRRRPGRSDRRVVRVELTAAGRRALAKRHADVNEAMARRLDGLTPGQRTTLVEAVDVLNAIIAHDDDCTAVRGASESQGAAKAP